jgi:hypothetical protein
MLTPEPSSRWAAPQDGRLVALHIHQYRQSGCSPEQHGGVYPRQPRASEVELTQPRDGERGRAEARLHGYVEALAQQECVGVAHRSLARFEPVRFDRAVVDLVETTARGLGLSTRSISRPAPTCSCACCSS